MGSGDQGVAVMPADKIFRTRYLGRLYGEPEEHYYRFVNGNLLAATREVRDLTDFFHVNFYE